MLTKKEFDILTTIDSEGEKKSQRQLAKLCGYSVGTVNTTLSSLSEKHFISDDKITSEGFAALAPYKVQRAVFLAAGFGSRLVPITLNTPKPLIRVHGKMIIESLLDATVAAGIEEIIIVRGYLGEQFDALTKKYPNIKFVENPLYNEGNNISSLLAAKQYLENAYIFESDIILKNPRLVTKYQFNSNYCGVPCERTDDWCISVEKGRISGVEVGGINGFRMVGISYWTENDGKKLSEDLEKVYKMPGGKERFWDSVPLTYCNKDFNLALRPCSFDDFAEIDTYNELKAIDGAYLIGN